MRSLTHVTLSRRAGSAMRAVALLVTCGAAGLPGMACEQDRAQRQRTLETVGNVDRQIAAGAVVREMRSPWDTGGVISSAPTNLGQAPAAAAGAQATDPTSGIGLPDTARARSGAGPSTGTTGAAATPSGANAGAPGAGGTPARPASGQATKGASTARPPAKANR